MGLSDLPLTITTLADGTKTVTAPSPIKGLVLAIDWVQGDIANTADVTVTADTPVGETQTLLTLTNVSASKRYNVREVEHDNVGAPTASGSTCYPLICGKPTITIAQGGNVKTGKVVLYYLPL